MDNIPDNILKLLILKNYKNNVNMTMNKNVSTKTIYKLIKDPTKINNIELLQKKLYNISVILSYMINTVLNGNINHNKLVQLSKKLNIPITFDQSEQLYQKLSTNKKYLHKFVYSFSTPLT